LKPRSTRIKLIEASNQKATADEEHERHGNLRRDEDVPREDFAAAGGTLAPPPSFRGSAVSGLDAWIAGARPNPMLVSTVRTARNSSTRESMATLASAGK
jgi:hypothetical protein